MKRSIFALTLLSLVSSIIWAQADAPPQSSPGAQPDQSNAQQKQDQSECMKWAKQQAGLDQSGSSQQPSTSGNANEPGAAPDKSTATKPADNSSQADATSGVAGAAGSMAGSLGGAANSKTAQLVKQAYTNCMEKKGYKIK